MEYMSSNLQNFSSTTKTHEQQQPEKIKPQEKSIRDEVGDEFKKPEQEMQEIKNPTVDLWMNRFCSWYSAIDRVSQNVKAKFVKMKSDIIKAISDKIKERSSKQEISKIKTKMKGQECVLKPDIERHLKKFMKFLIYAKRLLNKIPTKFYEMIKEERDTNYIPNIKSHQKTKIKNETIIILGLIYRDFLCFPEEKKKLQEKDARELQEVEKELEEQIREKYNPDDIFKNRNKIVSQEEQPSEETRMTIVQEEKWYQKIFNLIKGLFRKK